MKVSSALATTAVVFLLGARTAASSWGRPGGLDSFGRRYPTIDRDWSGSRRHVRYPQQNTGWPRQQTSHNRRDLPPQMPKIPLPPPSSPRSPPSPTSPTSIRHTDPNDDFTVTFLNYAGEDVVLSSLELSELIHAATADVAPPTRHSVLQILQQWDSNRDGGLNLSEFMRMYAELQHQMPSTFQQHWANLRRPLDETAPASTAPSGTATATAARELPSKSSHGSEPPMNSACDSTYTTPASMERVDTDAPAIDAIRPRKGRLNYIEKGERFFELVFDDEDGPLTVQTIVSTRIVGDVDSWAESDVW